ncbi:hypothetical protein [Marisediminitalea sp.]|uniref:hypothetical protein n=1 Tax=Marisediminitalea sp. TaxID=2662268 RepID=UPI0035186224
MPCSSGYPENYHHEYVAERQQRIKIQTELNETTALLCKLIRNYAAQHSFTPMEAAKDLQFNLGVTGLENWWVMHSKVDRDRIREKLLDTFDETDLQILKEVVNDME